MKRFAVFTGMVALTLTFASAQESSVQVTDHLTVPQWVNPEIPGELSGRVILPSTDGSVKPVASATVVMTDESGKSVRGRTDKEGRFTLKGVDTGVYAMSARAKDVFACCAMHVVDSKMADADTYPNSVEIAGAAIDYTIIKTAIIRYLPPIAKEDPYTLVGVNLKGISEKVVNENMFRVMQMDGGLKGRIHVASAKGDKLNDAGLLNIFLIKDGETIDRVVSKRNGSFQFDDVAPGEYSILAIGQAGLGMAGFELVDESAATSASASLQNNSKTFVTVFDDCCCCPEEFSMQIAPLPMAVESVQNVIIEDPMQYGESVVEGQPMEGQPMEGQIAGVDEFGNPAGVDQFGNPTGGFDQFGNPIGGDGFGGAGGGMAGGGAGGLGGGAGAGAAGGGGLGGGGLGGGGLGGGAGGGLGGLGGGLGGLASLAGLGAVGSQSSGSTPPVVIPSSP